MRRHVPWLSRLLRQPFFWLGISIFVFLAVYQYWVEQADAARETTIEAWSWTLADRVILVDPGHGGVDPGAVGPKGIKEKDITLVLGQKLADLLRAAGANVLMTRESDTDLSDAGAEDLLAKKRQDLARRVEYANQQKADIYLSIHLNSFPSARWTGAQTFYLRNSVEGKRLAAGIQSELIRVLGNNNRRQIKPEVYYIMEKAQMPAVIIEVGFISNPNEEALMTDPIYQEKIAQAIYSGVVRYYLPE